MLLKGENELALKIYERGLNKVKIGTDPERQKLQSLYTKLRQAQDPGKSLDPLEFLPLELAQMVIENLGMRDRVCVQTYDSQSTADIMQSLSCCDEIMEALTGVFP